MRNAEITLKNKKRKILGRFLVRAKYAIIRFLEELEKLDVKKTIKYLTMEMILVVRKPDYLGESKWEFKHENRTIRAKIKDADWLKRFQSREEEVHPGDFMKCKVEIEHLYSHDKKLITERYTVRQVIEVLSNSFNQTELFEDGDT